MSIISQLILAAVLVLVAYYAAKARRTPAWQRWCPNCGTTGAPVSVTRGSILIEIVLWLCFLVPGLIYSIWRLTTRYKACPSCSAPNMIPLDSPRALAARQGLPPSAG